MDVSSKSWVVDLAFCFTVRVSWVDRREVVYVYSPVSSYLGHRWWNQVARDSNQRTRTVGQRCLVIYLSVYTWPNSHCKMFPVALYFGSWTFCDRDPVPCCTRRAWHPLPLPIFPKATRAFIQTQAWVWSYPYWRSSTGFIKLASSIVEWSCMFSDSSCVEDPLNVSGFCVTLLQIVTTPTRGVISFS